MPKYKDLKRNFKEANQKNEALQKWNNDLHDKIRSSENENRELKAKCDKDHKIILKFSKGPENLDKLLCTQRASFNKEEIGYNHSNKKKTYKNFFVKFAPHRNDVRTYNYYSKIDHTTYSCPVKKPLSRIIQIWVPKRIKPPSMIANDFETKFNVKVEERFDFLFCRCA